MQGAEHQGESQRKAARCTSRMLTFLGAPLSSSPSYLQCNTTHFYFSFAQEPKAFWVAGATLTTCLTTWHRSVCGTCCCEHMTSPQEQQRAA